MRKRDRGVFVLKRDRTRPFLESNLIATLLFAGQAAIAARGAYVSAVIAN